MIEINLFDQDEFRKLMDSLDLSAEFLQAYHSYVECHMNYLDIKCMNADARHFIYLATDPNFRKGTGFSYFLFKPETKRCDLCGVYVDGVDLRSSGLGTLLLTKAVEVANQRGATLIVVAFTGKNTRNGKLFNGFMECTSHYPGIEFWVTADGKRDVINEAGAGGNWE